MSEATMTAFHPTPNSNPLSSHFIYMPASSLSSRMAIERSSYTTTPAVSSGESTPPLPPLSGQTTHKPKSKTEGHPLRHHHHHYVHDQDLDQDQEQDQVLMDVNTLSLALRAFQGDDTVKNNGHDKKKKKKTNKKKQSRTRTTTVIAATTTSSFYRRATVAAGSIVPGAESGTASDSRSPPASVTKPIIIVEGHPLESEGWEEDEEDTDTDTDTETENENENETSESESGPETETEMETGPRSSSCKKQKQGKKKV